MDKKLETLYDLCEILDRELEDANEKIRKAGGKLSSGDLDVIDKMTHALKSIKTTIAMIEADSDEGGYSGRYMPYYGGMSYAGDHGNMDGSSYAGRMNAKRDSMGRYSRNSGYSYAEDMEATKEEMRELAQKMPEAHRRKIERALDDLN
jgi:hypothetical protein